MFGSGRLHIKTAFIRSKVVMMSDRNEFQSFLEQEEEGDNLSKEVFTEIPPPLPPQISKALMGFSPMEQIELEGRAYRGYASGQMPWWVLLSGWIVFALPSLAIAVLAVTSGDLSLLLPISPVVVILWILWRGTQAKLTSERAKAQRQTRRRQDMRE
jgi:hypothetical protein